MILSDSYIQRDHVIQHRRLDIVMVYKYKRKCQIVDIAVPGEMELN